MHYLSHLAELGATNLHPHGHAATAQLIERLELQPGQKVLEIGCGTGETLARVALARKVTVIGVDVLPEMLRVARIRLRLARLQSRAQTVEVQAGAFLPFPNNSFDRIIMESVLGFQDVEAARMLLAEVFRVLKPGGRFVANEAVWKPSVPDDVVRSVYMSCMADFGLCHASEQNWSVEDWRRAMQAVGFQVASADTLLEPGPRQRGPRDGFVQYRLLLSQLPTAYYRIKGALSPRLVRKRLIYRTRLRHHRAHGHLIEARLFVLEKPKLEQDTTENMTRVGTTT